MGQSRPRGVLPVLVTPFGPDGEVDLPSLRRLTGALIAARPDGIVCFGLAGELTRLDDSDRDAVLGTVVEAAAGTPVIAGADHTGTRAAARRAARARSLGASAVMTLPPGPPVPSAGDLVDHYVAVADAAQCPVVVQDAPAWSGVPLPVDTLLEIAQRHPGVTTVKLEEPPIGDKAARLRQAGVDVLAGFGCLHLEEDLAAGVDGIMPGCTTPVLFREIWDAYQAGDHVQAVAAVRSVLPVLVAQMTSLEAFVETSKRLLAEAGVIDHPGLRPPVRTMPAARWTWIRGLYESTGADRYVLTPVDPAPDHPLLERS